MKDKTQRLGVNGAEEVFNHPFFSGIDLEKLQEKKIKAPFLPKTSDPELMRQSTSQVVRLKQMRESIPTID